jgi:hypothetical protein
VSILLELREAANRNTDVLQAKLLNDAADDLLAAMVGLTVCPTTSAMTKVNGAWVRAVRTLAPTQVKAASPA